MSNDPIPCPTCTGRLRETVGMVCQTCGTDYGPTAPTPCPEGFHWIGQSFAHCDLCGLPAWEHEGHAVPDSEVILMGHRGWVLRPWERGEREACRAKWDPALYQEGR
jgi:hypothetical protein